MPLRLRAEWKGLALMLLKPREAPQPPPGAEEQLYWPISGKLLWSWWDTTSPVPHRLSQKDVRGILGSPCSEDALGG